MCGVIVVDAGRSRSTCEGRGAYIHDHCLRYHHDFALFYQLLNRNFFTHRMHSFEREGSSENYGPRVYLLSYYFQIYKTKNPKIPCCNLFTFTLVCTSIYLLYLSLSDLILASDLKGLTTPLSRWVQVFNCLCRCIDWRLACTSYWIDTLVLKPRELLISTLLHHPFLFKGKPTQAQEVAGRISGAVAGEIYVKLTKYPPNTLISCIRLFAIFLSFASPHF